MRARPFSTMWVILCFDCVYCRRTGFRCLVLLVFVIGIAWVRCCNERERTWSVFCRNRMVQADLRLFLRDSRSLRACEVFLCAECVRDQSQVRKSSMLSTSTSIIIILSNNFINKVVQERWERGAWQKMLLTGQAPNCIELSYCVGGSAIILHACCI